MQCLAMPCIATQYNVMHNAMQCHAMQCHAVSCHAMSCNAMQYHAMPCNAMQYHAMLWHALPCNAMHCNAMQCLNRDISSLMCATSIVKFWPLSEASSALSHNITTSNYYVITVFSDVAHVFPLCQPLLLVCCYASMNPPHQHIYIFPHTLTLPQCSYSHSQL